MSAGGWLRRLLGRSPLPEVEAAEPSPLVGALNQLQQAVRERDQEAVREAVEALRGADASASDEGRLAMVLALSLIGETELMLEVAAQDDTGTARGALARGWALEHAGRDAEAAEAYALAEHREPALADAALGRARCSIALGDANAAVAAARRARNLAPTDDGIRLVLAEAHLAQGDASEALAAAGDLREAWTDEALTQLAELEQLAEPTDDLSPDQLLDRAETLLRLGDADAAARCARGGGERAPHDAGLQRRAGQTCLSAGDLSGAIEHLGLAVDLAPAHAETNDALGTAYLRAKLHDRAVKFASHAAAQAPGVGAYHYNLGNAWLWWERPKEAAACYRAALDCADPPVQAAFNLGQALERLEDLPGALAAYERARELAPEDPASLVLQARVLAAGGDDAAARGRLQAARDAGFEDDGAVAEDPVLARLSAEP